MENYIGFVHNLNGVSTFERLVPAAKKIIILNYIKQIKDLNELQKAIISTADENLMNFISKHLDLQKYHSSILYTTEGFSYTHEIDFSNIHAVISMKKVNNICRPNKLFRSINKLLPDAGIYIGNLETYGDRKARIYKKFGSIAGQIIWLGDFIFNRIIPRIPILERIYYYFTGARFHALSRAEVMGRLVYCGFEIIDFKVINGLSYFVAMKTREPDSTQVPSFYPVIKLLRVGMDGRKVGIYKFRTMHPYSEYIQDSIVKLNGYNELGKPANDFRLARWGLFMRRYWIDELPQIWNLIKGELKLVGLRPLSVYRFKELPVDLQTERIKYKPGCIPPYVALGMPDDRSNIDAERIYINDIKSDSEHTDLKYFFKAMLNIFTNRIRGA